MLLVGVSGGPGGEAALRHAAELSASGWGQVVAAHVRELPVVPLVGDLGAVAGWQCEREEAAGLQARRALESVPDWRFVACRGDPAAELAALAARLRAWMIVVGDRRRRLPRWLRRATVAERLRRQSLPVISVAPPRRPASRSSRGS